MKRIRHLFQSTFIVIFLFALGKVVGLVRLRAISRVFGTSPDYDAFTAANQLPELFVTLIAGGALAAAFIPVYSQYLTDKKQKEALRLANSTLTLVIAVLGTISALGAIFAPWLTSTILVNGYPPEQQALTASLMRIILIQTTLFGISGVLSSFLNAHQHFTLPALAPLALDIGYFVGIYAFAPILGIHGLAWGTVVGGLVHIGIQLPALRRYPFQYRPQIDWQLAGVREIIQLMGPRIITLGTVQFADLFIIRLLSNLPPGSTSAYFYAYALEQLPETLFGTAIAIVIFPTMAEMYNAGDTEGLKQTAVTALDIIWRLTIPAAAGIILLGQPAITLFLEDGAFTATSTRLVYTTLVFFSLRIVSEATLEIVARLFYAQHNTVIPMAVSLVWLTTNIICAYLFVDNYGIAGVAFASTLAFTLQSAILFVLNSRRLGGLNEAKLIRNVGKTLFCTLSMCMVILGLGQIMAPGTLYLLLGVALGGTTYLLLSLWLSWAEYRQFWQFLRQR
ncbi:MAG TPA: murein biosynthesis integral membrane protein MurJ [Anaerolineae bacterium]|nr:murein biosynthesis integral membrane protein MurJ [Anaerolineae bacterium]